MKSDETERRPRARLSSRRAGFVIVAAIAASGLSSCGTVLKSNEFGGLNETYHSGFVPTETALEQIPVGASKDQVLIVLGTPSTTADFGGQVFYYISQTRTRKALYQRQKIVDQRILAVYFDKNNNVERIANYGLKDGKVFDFIAQTTPTTGKDQGFLEQVLTGALNVGSPFGQ